MNWQHDELNDKSDSLRRNRAVVDLTKTRSLLSHAQKHVDMKFQRLYLNFWGLAKFSGLSADTYKQL